jgi:hypothetical protein
MLVPYPSLRDGATYIVPNEERPSLRRKGGEYPGCALREVSNGGPLQLSLDPTNCLKDESLMVLEIHLD